LKSSKIAIVCAFLAEGETFIEKFSLKLSEKKPFLIFKGDEISLIISGMGKLNSAAATAYLLSKGNFDKAINAGICASKNAKDLYEVFSVKSVIDYASGKKYPLKKEGATLTTLDKAAFEKPAIKTRLADMEASGFLTAAKKFLPSENIEIFKVVSDNFEEFPIKKEFVKRLADKLSNFVF